jgi:hypothetical protein
MADIKGITIEIDGNTSKLSKAISGLNSDLKSTQSTLRAVDKALKLDPGNVDLLEKKQQGLKDAIQDVEGKLKLEKEALEQLKSSDDGSEEMAKKQKELEREITQTEASLTGYKAELEQTDAALAEASGTSEEAADAQDKLGDAAQEAGDAARSSGDGWTSTKQILVDFAEAAVQVAIDAVKDLANAMGEAVTDSAAFADEILTLSSTTNLSTDTLQEFQYMSQLVDVDLGTITGSLTKLTNNMQTAATGSGSAAEAFKTLGVSATDSNGNLRSAEAVFYDVIDALGQVSNETERDALSMDLFGKSAQDLNPMIEAGGDTIAAFAQEAHDVGYVLDDETLSALGSVDDGFQRMQTTLEATRNNLVADLAPALSEAGTQLLEFVQGLDWDAIGQSVGQVVSTLSAYVPQILTFAGQIVAYVQANVIPTVQRIWATVSPVVSQIVTFISANLPAIQAIFETVMSAIGAVVQAVWPTIQTTISAALSVIQGVINVVMAAIDGDWSAVWSGIGALVGSVVNGIYSVVSSVFNSVLSAATSIWSSIETAISDPIGTAESAVSAATSAIQSFLNGLSGSGIISTFNRIRSSISNAINAAKNTVTNAVNAIKGAFNFSWSLPPLRLPHISVSGGVPPYGIGGRGSLPHFAINWYAKAMDQPYVLDGATIFGTMNGQLLGGGESGKEVILGLDKLKEYAGPTVVNINMTINAAPGQSEQAIAHAVSRQIQSEIMRKKAVWA